MQRQEYSLWTGASPYSLLRFKQVTEVGSIPDTICWFSVHILQMLRCQGSSGTGCCMLSQGLLVRRADSGSPSPMNTWFTSQRLLFPKAGIPMALETPPHGTSVNDAAVAIDMSLEAQGRGALSRCR